jgi:hypothetical protein
VIRQIARYRIEPNALVEALAAIGAFMDHIEFTTHEEISAEG